MTSLTVYESSCRSCDEYKDKKHSDIKAIKKGSVKVNGTNVEWILIDSFKKSVKTHYIFTTTSHHIGEKESDLRASLTHEAFKVGTSVIGTDFRLVVNTGEKASSMTHYHAHLISPGKDEVLPRAVANVQKVINELNTTDEIKSNLCDSLLQKKS